jgi:hypothetical protein
VAVARATGTGVAVLDTGVAVAAGTAVAVGTAVASDVAVAVAVGAEDVALWQAVNTPTSRAATANHLMYLCIFTSLSKQ